VNQDNRIVSNQKGWGRKEGPKEKLQKQTTEDETMRTRYMVMLQGSVESVN